MPPPPRRHRDRTFLYLAGVAALGGIGAIGTSLIAVARTMREGHPTTTYFFFSLWGIAALCGAAANVATYFQTGDPPEKPPRGGRRAVVLRLLESPTPPPQTESERKAA